MAVKIKLMRLGKIRQPYYRVVVADSRTRRNGRAIETIGKYHPKGEPSLIEIDSERAQYWLGVGALPTEPVESLLKVTGDWQKFHGEPGAEGTLKTQPAKQSKLERFQQALAEANQEPTTEATTPRAKRSGGGNDRVGATADAAPAEAATKDDEVVDATKDADAPAAES
ncbi:30S ribosomal protein S16 [Pseudonocardia endophytica]|uniref:Small ribosomal subunit protein bS16 n=1 Tax=Pseudonocardia endophytica TaxID=401976 RepID=A0A4R1HVK8_PSEEN|nr:30S ribosomal protein S16 [Pseudonocardia endophytica]TCK25461.1 SSU ribosomal protein S16P [Pseudonocardia endophytica]